MNNCAMCKKPMSSCHCALDAMKQAESMTNQDHPTDQGESEGRFSTLINETGTPVLKDNELNQHYMLTVDDVHLEALAYGLNLIFTRPSGNAELADNGVSIDTLGGRFNTTVSEWLMVYKEESEHSALEATAKMIIDHVSTALGDTGE